MKVGEVQRGTNQGGARGVIKQDVLNAGYVRLVEYMGGDESVIRNARRCWRSEDKSNEESDRNLIRHLLRKGHM